MARMYTAANVNLTLPDIFPNYYNRSCDKNYETSNKTDPSSNNGDILDKVIITLYAIIFALGTIGNGLVIWIAGFRMKKIISAVWFLNLAIADFLCCASLPLRIAEWVYLDLFNAAYFHFDAVLGICLSNIILFIINMSASVLFLVAMSIDRCVSVMWPFWAKVHRTRKLVRITAGIIWVVSLLLAGLVLFSFVFIIHDFNEWCKFDCWRPQYRLSLSYYDYIQNDRWTIQLIRLVMMFVIPFLIILISYVIVFIKIRKSKRSQRSQRPYRIITAVILCFFICWFPYYVWPLIPVEYITQFCTVNSIITILAFLNSCMNPIIYVFMSQDVKLCFFRSIPSRLEKALSEHPNGQCRERGDCEDSRTTEG